MSGDGEGSTGGAPQFNKSGRYQVLDKLGSGGMGTVVKALDLRLGRFVALKRANVPGDQVTSAQTEAFLREARVLAQLRHFNLPEIYDIDSDEHGPFISMEFIAGRTLLQEHQANGNKMDPRLILDIGEQMCSALSTCHKKNIIHRDIKPSNILLTPDGVPKLIDFGIAAAGTDAAGNNLRNESTVAGTRSYASPEQLKDATRVDARSDLYSLAATLYALFTSDTPTAFKEQLLPPPLRPVLKQGLAKDPAQRFATADDFRKALRSLADVTMEGGPAPKVATDDRPLLEKLKDEVRAHQDEGRFSEAILVWQRIAKLTGKPELVAKAIERCQSRLRERDLRRTLEKIGGLITQNKIPDAEQALFDLFAKVPDHPEALALRDNLNGRRRSSVKKFFFDARGFLHENQYEAALENVVKAQQINRDSDLKERLDRIAAVCRARVAMQKSDRLANTGDYKSASEQLEAAQAFLNNTPGIPANDPIFADLKQRSDKYRLTRVTGGDLGHIWLYVAAASPGVAIMLGGGAFAGGKVIAGGGALMVLLLGVAIYGYGLTKKGDGKALTGLAAQVDELVERQRDSSLLMKISAGILAFGLVLAGVGLLLSLMSAAGTK